MCCSSERVIPSRPRQQSEQEVLLQNRLDEIASDPSVRRYGKLPPDYRNEFSTAARVKGVAVFVFIVIGITAFALLYSGHLTTFPHDFVNMFAHVDPTKLMIGLGVTTLLVAGAGFVIHRARKKEDPYVEGKISCLSNHIEGAMYEYTKDGTSIWGQAYIDKSTLDISENGKAYLYAVKDCKEHYKVSTVVTLVTPFYTIGAIVFHAIRMCIVPFYVLVCCAIDACDDEKQKRYELVDVVMEPWKSLKQVVKSPFYGLAFMAAGIYSLFDPMGGRVLGANIERDWNDGATRAEGYWSIGGKQSLWSFANLDFNFFLAGCWQPIGIVEYQDNKIVEGSGKSLSRMVEERRQDTSTAEPDGQEKEMAGHEYNVYSFTELDEQSAGLRQEYWQKQEELNENKNSIT